MVTEKRRLIDANAIYDAVERRYQMSSGIEHRCERDLLDLICSADTVDAVEVVHGKWELRNVTSGMNGRYWCCSACGCIRSYWEYKAEDNYCFKCGAKMDGGNEDGNL